MSNASMNIHEVASIHVGEPATRHGELSGAYNFRKIVIKFTGGGQFELNCFADYIHQLTDAPIALASPEDEAA